MVDSNGDFISGFVERKGDGRIEGCVSIEGIDLSPITGKMFKRDDDESIWLWLRRKELLEYDERTQKYRTRQRTPIWEAYLKKQLNGNAVAFKGEFYFMRLKFSIVGVWDSIIGRDKGRLNLYVDRKGMNEQDIIQKINNRDL